MKKSHLKANGRAVTMWSIKLIARDFIGGSIGLQENLKDENTAAVKWNV